MTSWLLPALAIYLAAGLISVLVGPFARDLRSSARELCRSIPHRNELEEYLHQIKGGEPLPRWKGILNVIIFYAVVIPIAPILWWIRSFRTEPKSVRDQDDVLESEATDPDDTRLYFSQIGGAGTLACQRCGHREEIVAFLHGHGTLWYKTGLQCQTCGRLCTFERREDGTGVPDFCNCLGEPTRDDPLFCPACRSTELDYLMSYIT